MFDAESVSLDERKQALRKEAKLRRRAAFDAERDLPTALRDRVLATLNIPAGTVVSGFWPLADELDLRPLLQALDAGGCQIVLPAMTGKDRPLVFRDWKPGDELVPAGFGTLEPAPSRESRAPDLLLVPLLAFDRQGYRLGYGGGFYDRSLAELRAAKKVTAVGVAFSALEVDLVPKDANDQQLDWIVTEREAIEFG
ncbi:5-formyltetrahydrofolate cyclo-ligase [Pelagibius sp. Alg239-R121]|uniref:5-formyltetrahydrofolate cyclo-ligase n=1 Tax=Pelagibius sp. Alg239-R121 TaxID=2993448 RepID=UPI0024A6A262|nr:5-formyltetrahydrofolate cyclo-ligase [Pelagibius sp. Alg239-R121]